MRKIILEKLKARFEGVSDFILDRIAEKLAKTVTTEEEATTAVAGVTLQQLFESYGDSRATEAQVSAVANYEKKYGLKDGAKVDDGGKPGSKKNEPDDDGDKDTPAWAKALISSVKTLSDDVATMKGEKVTASRRQQIDEIIKDLPEHLRKPYSYINLTSLSDEEFESLKDGIKGDVTNMEKEDKQNNAVFGKPPGKNSSTNVKEASDKEVDAVVDMMNI